MPIVKRPVRNASEEGIEAEIPEIEPIKYGGQPRDDGTVVSPEEDKAAWEEKLAKYSNKPTTPPEGPREDGRQDLEDLMSRYEAAVSESADRARNKGLIGFGIGLSDPNAGKAFTESMQQYIHEPLDQISGSLSTGQAGAKLNKSVSEQFAVDEDNDPNSPGSVAMRDVVKKYGIEVPDNATAAQLKRALPMVSLEIKGTQQMDQKKFVEGEKNQRDELKRQLTEEMKKLDRQSREKVASMLIAGGFDKMVVQEALQASYAEAMADLKGPGASDIARSDRSIRPNIFKTGQNDDVWVLQPGVPPPDQTTNAKLEEIANFAAISNAYAKTVMDLYEKLMSGQDVTDTWARLQSVSKGLQQSNVKGWLNGVANGKDMENSAAEVGMYDSPEKFIASQNIEKTKQFIQNNKAKYEAVMGVRYRKAKANPSAVVPVAGAGGGGSGRSRSGNINSGTKAANEILMRKGYQPITPAAPPTQTTQPGQTKKRRWNPQTQTFEVVQ